MFKKYSPLVLASLLGIGALAMPASTASAGALPYVQQNASQAVVGESSLLQQAGRRDRRRGHHHHHHRRHGGFNHFGFYAAPLIFGGGYYGNGYYGRPYHSSRYYARSGSAHAEWCANRYRSYDWNDNTWVSYSGRVYECRSPYRY